MNKIKITKDLKFDLEDLMDEVDIDKVFTLRDIITICMNSEIPMEILGAILQCPYIPNYFDEMDKVNEDEDEDKDIVYLELKLALEHGDIDEEISHMWSFYGVGKEGVIPQDIISHSTEEEIKQLKETGYTQSYAIEFSPICKIADYPIKISKEVSVSNWDNFDEASLKIKGKPTIKLIDLLYYIFWELSFLGSPEDRDKKKEDLIKSVDKFEKSSKDGTLKMLDGEQVKALLEENNTSDN